MSSLTLDGAGRWAEVPQLPPEVERAAARALVDFLREVEKAVLEAKAAGPEALEELHRVWDFRSFDRAWLPFILPMLGSGEVRITLHDGLARMEETGIPALWRLQMGGHDSFILGRIPRCVWLAARSGEETVGTIVNNGSDVFAAPAILEELRAAQQKIDWSRLPESPAHMVELTKQPRDSLHARHGRHPGRDHGLCEKHDQPHGRARHLAHEDAQQCGQAAP